MKKLNSSTGSTAVSITLLVFAALCPFLALPAALVVAWMDDHPKTSSEITFWILAIALAIILAVSPILTILSISQNGFRNAFNEGGFGFAITVMEMHLSGYFAWKYFRHNKVRDNKKSILNKINKDHADTISFVTLLFTCILFFVFLFSDWINPFWAFITLGYGLTFSLIMAFRACA